MVFFILALSMFMETVDSTILNASLPAISKALNVHPIDLKLALISYLLGLAVFIPISGWVADKYGIKKTYLAAIALFTLSSMACGFATNLTLLIIARIFQGIGGAFLMPLGRLIILKMSARHEIMSKTNMVVMIGSMGLMLGPLIGGYITHYFSWSWIFWVNLPFGLLSYILAKKYLPQFPKAPVKQLDKVGFILFGTSLSCLMFSLSMFSESSPSYLNAISILLLACLLLFAYFLHSKNKPNAIIQMKLFELRTFRISVFSNLLCRLSFGGLPFLLPLLFQLLLGYSAKESGIFVAPIALGVFFIKPCTRYILDYFGYKNVLLMNTLAMSISMMAFCLVDTQTTAPVILTMTFIYGFLMSLQYTSMNSLAYANIEDNQQSAATSIMSTMQQMAQSLGVAIAAIFLRVFAPEGILNLAAFQHTFLLLGMISYVAIILFLQLQVQDGEELLIKSNLLPENMK